MPGPFYVAGRSDDYDYVWQHIPMGLLPLYVSYAHYPARILPAMELAMLSQCPDIPNTGCTEPAVILDHDINSLQLSPDKRYLAWLDTVSYCPGSRCFGSGKILVWNLADQESQTLFEYPYHIHQEADQAITGLAWAPDSRSLAYIHTSRSLGWARVRTIDLETGSITTVGKGFQKAEFAWSPSGERIAFSTFDEAGMPLVSIASEDGRASVTLKPAWKQAAGLAWSPDGSRLAVAALPAAQPASWQVNIVDAVDGATMQQVSLPHGFQIISLKWSPDAAMIALAAQAAPSSGNIHAEKRVYCLSLSQLSLTQVAAGKAWLDNPQWSPDAQVVAANTYAATGPDSNGIAIYRPSSGQVVAQLSLPGASHNWLWSHASNAILIDLQDHSKPCSPQNPPRLGLYHWRDQVLAPVSIPYQKMDQQIDCNTQLRELTW